MQGLIYLDHHSTTPVDPRVLDEMMPYFARSFGNASSADHQYGQAASEAVELARARIAESVGAQPDEIVFTSGATESDNMALEGTMAQYKKKGDHLITCVTEHKAVLDTARRLEAGGRKVTYLPVNREGEIDMAELESSIRNTTVMISIMAANNEIGTIHDVKKIGRIAHERDVIFHTDATQATGHIPLDVRDMGIDMMSISAHKMYGPKGIGALYLRRIRPRVRLEPMFCGGGQERGIRSGTLNVPGIVGFGKAVEIAVRDMSSENERLGLLAARMSRSLEDAGGALNGHPTRRLSHNLSMCFDGVEGKAIINSVADRVAISAGSACTTATVEPSHVIVALGYGEHRAHTSIRIGLGRFNTMEEADLSSEIIARAVGRLRRIGDGGRDAQDEMGRTRNHARASVQAAEA